MGSEDVFYVEDESTERLQLLYAKADILMHQCIPEKLHICHMLYQCYKRRKIAMVSAPWGRELFGDTDLCKNSKLDRDNDNGRFSFLTVPFENNRNVLFGAVR